MGILRRFFQKSNEDQEKTRDSGPERPLAQEPSATPRQGIASLPGGTMMFSTVPESTTSVGPVASLVIQSGEELGRSIDISREEMVTIGHAPECQIQLSHPSVSPSHALIRFSDGSYRIFDLGSANGTWVNGSAVTGRTLSDGSRITIGASEIAFTTAGGGVLTVTGGPSVGRRFPVGENDLVIGRHYGSDRAQLEDATISRRHALIRPTAQGYLVYDLGSANGTVVDDVPLTGSTLQNGDTIKLGEMEIQFVLHEPT